MIADDWFSSTLFNWLILNDAIFLKHIHSWPFPLFELAQFMENIKDHQEGLQLLDGAVNPAATTCSDPSTQLRWTVSLEKVCDCCSSCSPSCYPAGPLSPTHIKHKPSPFRRSYTRFGLSRAQVALIIGRTVWKCFTSDHHLGNCVHDKRAQARDHQSTINSNIVLRICWH